MVNKPASGSKAAASVTAGEEGKFRGALVGSYFFVVIVVPVNSPGAGQIMYPTQTWHFMRHVARDAQASGFKLQVSGTPAMTNNAFRIEVLDLDASFRSEEEVKAYLEGDGSRWLVGSVDHRICRAAIEPRPLTEI